MKYVRTKDGRIIPTNIATHELTKTIYDAGYLKILSEGAYVTIGKQWTNFYGRWVDIIDEEGRHYSIRPNEVKEVTRELPQANTIERLCDRFVVIYENEEPVPYKNYLDAVATQKEVYGATWTDKGLIYVAKANNKGELELL